MKKNSGVDGKLDDAWAELVKLRAGMRCEYCGKQTTLNSHHIFSRSKKSTRWDPMNGVSLCVAHHVFSSRFSAHKTSVEFFLWLEETKGRDYVDRLRIKANSVSKLHTFEKELLLQELRNDIKALKNS